MIDSGAGRHSGNCHRDVLTFLPTSFLMNPAIGPPVTIPAVLLGVQIMTHAATTRLLLLEYRKADFGFIIFMRTK